MKYNIYIDDEIGWYGCTGKDIRRQLEDYTGKPCSVFVSSIGGSLSDGLEIYQAFKDHGDVTVNIFGITASAATVLAMGAKRVQMSRNAVILIHCASQYQDIWGALNSEQIEEAISQLRNNQSMLDKMDEIIANIYALRGKGEKEAFTEKMKGETWLTAEEALELGLIDGIIEEGEATKMTDSLQRKIVARGYPVPHLQEAAQPSFMDRLRKGLVNLGIIPEKNENKGDEGLASQTETPAAAAATNTNITMNKSFTSIMACLAVESLAASEDGSITLSAEQMQAVEAALAAANKKAKDATAQLAKKDEEISALNEQVENLKKDDEGDPGEGVPAPATSEAASAEIVSTMSNLLRGI